MTQDMDMEEVEVDMPYLRVTHGDQTINNPHIHQIGKMQRDLLKGKSMGGSQGTPSSTTRNLGIKTNPLKPLKKIHREENKRGRKHHKKKIEEIGALLIDSCQAIISSDNYFPSQPKS
jgi:hypothetical protein